MVVVVELVVGAMVVALTGDLAVAVAFVVTPHPAKANRTADEARSVVRRPRSFTS